MDKNFEVMLAEEGAIAEVQSMALRILRSKQISQTELATRMGVSPSYVSQILTSDDPKNLSLKKAANLFYHLNEELIFTCLGVQALDRCANQVKREQKSMYAGYRARTAWNPCNSNDFDEEFRELAVA